MRLIATPTEPMLAPPTEPAIHLVRPSGLTRALAGAVVGSTIAMGTLAFFALLLGWADLLALTWRPAAGVGCLFGLLTGALHCRSPHANDTGRW